MVQLKKKIKTSKGLQEHTFLGCAVTRNKTAWCYRLCPPDEQGIGRCGRIAPHSLKSAIQIGIEKHKEKKVLETHFAKLSNWYISQNVMEKGNIGVHITTGEAEIFIPNESVIFSSGDLIDHSGCIKFIYDAAGLAINSLTGHKMVLAETFNIIFTGNQFDGDLIARGRFLNMAGEQYMSEAVLTDSKMNELCRANGAFVPSNKVLDESLGYCLSTLHSAKNSK